MAGQSARPAPGTAHSRIWSASRRCATGGLRRRRTLWGRGPFGGGRGRGRTRRGDVRVALLLLLAEEPRNGYQLMQAIEERSDGRWRPSPGSVYPTLAQLEDEGLIRAAERDGTKLFELTDAGREHVAEHRRRTAPWEGRRRGVRARSAELALADAADRAAAAQVVQAGDEAQRRARRDAPETRRSAVPDPRRGRRRTDVTDA